MTGPKSREDAASLRPRPGAIAENIAFLAHLKHAGQFKTNPLASRPPTTHDHNSSLAFKHEMIIGKAFALILVNTNDKSKIGAVCIEECSDRDGLILRSATNTGSQKEREAAFKRIAECLKNLPGRGHHMEQEDELLREIICVCQKRILGRLRSRHAPQTNKTKPPLFHKLQHALQIMKRYDHGNDSHVDLKEKADVVIGLLQTLEHLERSQAFGRKASDYIQELFLGVRALLPLVLNSLTWLSTMKAGCLLHTDRLDLENAVERLQKIDQYRHAAKILTSLTRRYRCLRDLHFEAVTMHDCSNAEASVDLPTSGLLSHFYNGQHLDHTQDFSSYCTTKTFKTILAAAQQERRVHAEIQLLYHYENIEPSSSNAKPRVICSEKHACFLCNVFIRAHGQFYTPSTHGKFYPRWRLPKPGEFRIPATEMMASLYRFNGYLEEEIMARLLHGPQRYISATESVLVEAGNLTPSFRSSSYASEPPITSITYKPTAGESTQVSLHKDLCVESLRRLNSSHESGIEQCIEDGNAKFPLSRGSATDSGRSISSISTRLAFNHTAANHFVIRCAKSREITTMLLPGQELTTYLPSGCKICVQTRSITLELEHTVIAPRSGEKVHGDLILRLSCTAKNTNTAEDACPTSTSIDLGAEVNNLSQALPENVLFTEGGLRLCKNDQVVTLRALRKDNVCVDGSVIDFISTRP